MSKQSAQILELFCHHLIFSLFVLITVSAVSTHCGALLGRGGGGNSELTIANSESNREELVGNKAKKFRVVAQSCETRSPCTNFRPMAGIKEKVLYEAMPSGVENTFLVEVIGEFMIGMLGNGFIVLVNCIDWVKRPKFSSADCILTGLATSRISQLWKMLFDSLPTPEIRSVANNVFLMSKEAYV
eukprot:bmy_14243T0